jgi:hypothetical protein
MGTIGILALIFGTGWAAGINLYATILVLGYLGLTGVVVLPPGLEVLSDPLVISTAGLMYFIEFFADKIPGLDSGWDGIHTFVRIPAGAMLATSVFSGFEISQTTEFMVALSGGAMAANSHFTKAGSRLIINTSPNPISNWSASLVEDLMVIIGLWAALNHPILFLVLLIAFIALSIWLLPKIWRTLKSLYQRIAAFYQRQRFGGVRHSDPITGHHKNLKSLFQVVNNPDNSVTSHK